MIFIGLTVAVLALGALGLITHLALNAPEGWEDEDGFHIGVKDDATTETENG